MTEEVLAVQDQIGLNRIATRRPFVDEACDAKIIGTGEDVAAGVAEQRLRDTHGLGDDELERISRAVDDELDRVEASALAAPFPEALDPSEFSAGGVA